MKNNFRHSWFFKTVALLVLGAGLFFILLSGINIYQVIKFNESLPPNSLDRQGYEMGFQIIAMVLMFLGVYLFVLAFGKKPGNK